jgi:hypothetical protein
VPCHCVFRAVFRACYNRFRECAASGAQISAVRWGRANGRQGLQIYSRLREEYVADFCLVSRRALDDEEHRIFRLHFLLGADWKLCCRQLKMDRGEFFHWIYRIEQKLGRVFAELKPYPLFPLDEYFASVHGTVPVRQGEGGGSWRLPLSA